jgi:hypothetical protein
VVLAASLKFPLLILILPTAPYSLIILYHQRYIVVVLEASLNKFEVFCGKYYVLGCSILLSGKFTDVLGERTASVFDPECGGNTLLVNVSTHPPDHTASRSTRHNFIFCSIMF